MSSRDVDVLVIGAGPAGTSAAIHLARAGWRVAVMEQSAYPRRKVCGECLGPAGLRLLRELGIVARVGDCAGPEIRRLGWMTRTRTVVADMPSCVTGPYRYGRAIGRFTLDALLLERAREIGVHVIQPARAERLRGAPGAFVCEYRSRAAPQRQLPCQGQESISASIVIDAHGSWERGPAADPVGSSYSSRPPGRCSDLFGFKACFAGTALPPGLLALMSLAGGYGGMVVAGEGRTTVACCLRRDVLRDLRMRGAGLSAGAAVEGLLRSACRGVAAALDGASLVDGWQSVGPLRPGLRPESGSGVIPVGNAAVEAHPLIGEGICMALECASLLAAIVGPRAACVDERFLHRVREAYVRAARATFARRLSLGRVYAHMAMRRPTATLIADAMRRWPRTLTLAARLAGKARTGEIGLNGAQECT